MDGSKTCTKCHIRYRIEVEKDKDFLYDSEEWFDIKGFEGRYAVSNYLRILRREYNVRKLYQEASRACMEEDASDFCGVDDV